MSTIRQNHKNRLRVGITLYKSHAEGVLELLEATELKVSQHLIEYLIKLALHLYRHRKAGGTILLRDKHGKEEELELL